MIMPCTALPSSFAICLPHRRALCMSPKVALEAADSLLAGSCSPARTAAHVAALHAFTIHGDAPAQAAVRGALAADLAPLTVLLSALVCGKKVRGDPCEGLELSSWAWTCNLKQGTLLRCLACVTCVLLLLLPHHRSASQPKPRHPVVLLTPSKQLLTCPGRSGPGRSGGRAVGPKNQMVVV